MAASRTHSHVLGTHEQVIVKGVLHGYLKMQHIHFGGLLAIIKVAHVSKALLF